MGYPTPTFGGRWHSTESPMPPPIPTEKHGLRGDCQRDQLQCRHNHLQRNLDHALVAARMVSVHCPSNEREPRVPLGPSPNELMGSVGPIPTLGSITRRSSKTIRPGRVVSETVHDRWFRNIRNDRRGRRERREHAMHLRRAQRPKIYFRRFRTQLWQFASTPVHWSLAAKMVTNTRTMPRSGSTSSTVPS